MKRLVNLEDKKPFVYSSGRYENEFNKTTVAFPLTSSRNGNVLVFDLRYNLDEVDSEKTFPVVKELCYNKCPAVAPLGVLDVNDGWEKIGLTKEQVEENLKILLKNPEFAEQMRSANEERPEWPEAVEPEAAIYEGFLGESDRVKVAAVRAASVGEDAGGARVDAAAKLADFHPEFDDPRLPELLLHYKGRNFPMALSETEQETYENYRRARLERQAPKFLEELEKVEDDFVREELMLYFQSLQ